ncbi:MAG: hypothetical protein NW701_17915 [Nitrospira sp.]
MAQIFEKDTVALDYALQTALIRRDFVALRKALVDWGYPIPEDESEPDLEKALLQSLEIHEHEPVDLDSAARTFQIEGLIRDREADRLHLLLFLLGHKIEKPEFVTRLTEKEGPGRCADECPICFPH